MDKVDREIAENVLAKQLGRIVSEWSKRHDVDGDVEVSALIQRPTCYVDEVGVVHTGMLITVDISIADDDFDDEDE